MIENLLLENGFLDDVINEVDEFLPPDIREYLETLTEAEYVKAVEKLKLEIMDVETFIKRNNVKEVTNPVTFVRDGYPSPDGLLSNEIFGITKEDRAGTFAYIDLGDLFMDPSCYKAWYRMDSRIKSIVHQTEKYIVNADGDLEVSEKGKTGVKFLKDNFDKIKIKSTESRKRDVKIEYLQQNKDRMFLTKYLVIPAYFRDVNSTGKNVGVGAINKLYASLLIAVSSLKSTQDYGFDNTGAISGRIQETLLTIYDWFVGNNNERINDEGTGMAGKKGIIRRANMTKTPDYSSRLVISAVDMKVESLQNKMVTLERSALPLSSVIANFKPFMIFHIKKFFENEFGGISSYPVINKKGEVEYKTPKDPLIEFSDERIEKELKKFTHSYSNRFVPIEVPLDNTKEKYYMKFKGRNSSIEDSDKRPDSLFNRKLTWCDVFFMAAVEATRDKCVLITRFPMDSYFNQFPTKIVVSSTKKTEPIYVDNTYYEFYPLIREEDINSDTSKVFIDTGMISNLYLKAIGADFDGDMISTRGVYIVEANEELERFIYSKGNFIDVGGNNVRTIEGDCLQSLYSLTKILPGTIKLGKPEF